MPSMRRLIDTTKGRQSQSTPDVSALLTQFTAVSISLANRPYDLRWQREWTDEMQSWIKRAKVQHDLQSGRHEGDAEPFDFKQAVLSAAQKVTQRHIDHVFMTVKHDVEAAIDAYQMHFREKTYGHEPDWDTNPYYGVETSDYMTAKAAEKRLARTIEISFDPQDLASYSAILTALQAFLATWDRMDFKNYDSGLEEPTTFGLSNLLPLILTTLRLGF